MHPTLIHHFLENSARLYPDKTALVHEKTRATYSEINTQADKLANFLISMGIERADRIAIIFENCLEYVVSYYGCLKAGSVVAPLSTELKSDTLRHILTELSPRILIASPRLERLIRDTDISACGINEIILVSPKQDWSGSSIKLYTWERILEQGDADNSFEREIQETDLASIIYTSGSTGTPKGVMLSHQNVVVNTNSICQYLKLTHHDIQMVVLPFYYVMGKSLLNTHFAVGGRVVINNKFAFSASVINQMIAEECTGFSGVPSTFAYLLHRSPLARNRERLTSLRYCSQAGGHMAKHTKIELREALPAHTEIYIMYGATEASARLSWLPPEQYNDKIESIGIPIPGVTLAVLDSDGNELPPGETGELVAKGENIMQGYWQDSELTNKVLDHHGYHTGDLAYRDSDGYFYITGRMDNQLKVGGHRINAQEIEDTLMATGLLIEATVIGKPDILLGNSLIAFAVPKNDTCVSSDIIKICANLLPKYKLPESIMFLRSLPKTSNGKIDKYKIKQLIQESSG